MDILIVCVVALLASVLTFFSGFGLGTLLLPAFALFMPVEHAIAMTAVVHLLNGLFKLALLRKHIDTRVLLRFGLPAVLAAVLGAWLLSALGTLPALHAYTAFGHRFEILPLKLVIGLEDGTLPHEASLEEGRLDEERRLLYVGITRAKEQLWLSHSREAQRWGTKLRLTPSRFLDELPDDEIQRDGADPVADATRKQERASAGFAAIKAMLEG